MEKSSLVFQETLKYMELSVSTECRLEFVEWLMVGPTCPTNRPPLPNYLGNVQQLLEARVLLGHCYANHVA